MEQVILRKLFGFYANELIGNILSFWAPSCLDEKNGGYCNCYSNDGSTLLSRDKYTWSQGRFVWMWSRLSQDGTGLFRRREREEFLRLAKSGRDFLMKHCLLVGEEPRCVFLMEEDGRPKKLPEWPRLDMSIYADCFAVLGLAAYARATGERESYTFAKTLYQSILKRVKENRFFTLPYPLSEEYRAHGIPMILSNLTHELLLAAQALDPAYCSDLKAVIQACTEDILGHFVDENTVLREVVRRDGSFPDGILGRYTNPGHTLEDAWFMIDAADDLGRAEWLPKIIALSKNALEKGWDAEYGGLLLFAGLDGGQPLASENDKTAEEPMARQALRDWGNKVWWVHSEALYATLLCYQRTQDPEFLSWHDKVFDYTFATFPNPDREVREWIQIRGRDGKPQDKVVALPVKDPFHITRNLILILDLLHSMLESPQ